MRNLAIALLFPILSFAQSDTSGKRPDFAQMSYTDIKWAKAEGRSFWFYYKPTQYFFKDKEFQTIPLETGDFLVYIFEMEKYVLLHNFAKMEEKKELPVELASERNCVFIRLPRDKFAIYDHGRFVDGMESLGINNIHQVVYRSSRTDKRYWIAENDFFYGPISVPIGIISE